MSICIIGRMLKKNMGTFSQRNILWGFTKLSIETEIRHVYFLLLLLVFEVDDLFSTVTIYGSSQSLVSGPELSEWPDF